MLEGLATELEARCEARGTALVDSVSLGVAHLGLFGEVGILEVDSVLILFVFVLLRQLKAFILLIASATIDPLTPKGVALSLSSAIQL